MVISPVGVLSIITHLCSSNYTHLLCSLLHSELIAGAGVIHQPSSIPWLPSSPHTCVGYALWVAQRTSLHHDLAKMIFTSIPRNQLGFARQIFTRQLLSSASAWIIILPAAKWTQWRDRRLWKCPLQLKNEIRNNSKSPATLGQDTGRATGNEEGNE